MNPSAAFFVGSDTVSFASGRKFSEVDFEQTRRLETFHPSSLPSDRSGLARTGSGMAGSMRGGLSSLLSSPAVTGNQLHRSSGSDQFLPSTYYSDISSADSGTSRSFQALSSLSVTPRSKDKSPGAFLPGSARMMTALSSSPQVGFLPPPTSSLGQLSSSQPHHMSSFSNNRASGSFASRPGSQVPILYRQPYPAGSSSLHDTINASASVDRFGSVLLQARPSKPSFSRPIQRSVGFSLPGFDTGSSLTPIASVNQLSEHGSVGSYTGRDTGGSLFDSLGPTNSYDSEGFMTPVTSMTTLDPSQVTKQHPDNSFLTPVSSLNTLIEGSALQGDALFSPTYFASLKPLSGSMAQDSTFHSAPLGHSRGRSQQREDVLRLVELANGVKPAGGKQGYSKEQILAQAQKEHPIFQDPLVKRAFEVAASAHDGQVRKNGMPVLSHCVETALILARIGAGSTVVAAGLLHDCLDDTPMTVDQLEAAFGAPLAEMVRGVSNLSSLSQRMRDAGGALSTAESDRMEASGRALSDGELDRLRMMILSMVDVRVVLVKLADRIHNLRTISALPEEKQRRVASETLEVFAPLANRLGIWTWKAEIEDICFRTLWPRDYVELQEAVQGTHGDEAVLRSIAKLDAELRAGDVEFTDLHGRAKNFYSIFSKMQNKGKTLGQVFDRRGIRLIVPDVTACYDALSAVRRVWGRELEDHFKDYIKHPKGNGYQSIHIVLEDEDGHPLEIQIRTEAMHEAAEYGVAAHWRYKETGKGVGRSSSKSMCISESGNSFCISEEDKDLEEKAAMQRVEWVRYVLSWVAELTDTKVRLEGHGGCKSGSPGCRSASPGCTMGFTGAGSRLQGVCQFPEHAEDCCFQPGFSPPCGRIIPSPPLPESEPLLVFVVDADKVEVRKLRGNGTREMFLRDYLAERGKLHMLHSASLLVNSELVSPAELDEKFRIGDQLEVITDAPLSPVGVVSEGPLPSTPGSLEEDDLLFDAEMMGSNVESGEGLLPEYVKHEDYSMHEECPLALEFQRRKLAVAFGSTDNLALRPVHSQVLN